jgi:DNA-binding transcriptional LysR family regulator
MHEIVDFRELKVFLTLADELHFGRTAELLGLTQSRVSQSLRSLEHKLGERLVDRTSRRVALTVPGERFRAAIAPPFAGLMAALEEAAPQRLSGTLRIGLRYPNSGGELLRVIEAFEARHPDCDVQVTGAPQDDPGGPLRSGEVDLLAMPLLMDPTDHVVVVATLDTEPRVLAVARNHPLAARRQVELEDLGDFQVVAPSILPVSHEEAWIPFRTPSGRPIERYPQRPDTSDEIALLVARGRVVYPTVPASEAYFGPPSIVCVPLAGLPPARKVLLAQHGPWNPRLRAFARIARQVVGDSAVSREIEVGRDESAADERSKTVRVPDTP